MKTTLEIDDDLYREAKAVAALTGRKMKDLVSDGLRWAVRPAERRQTETPATAARKLAACFARADELMREAPPGPTAREHLNRGRGRQTKS